MTEWIRAMTGSRAGDFCVAVGVAPVGFCLSAGLAEGRMGGATR